MSAKLSRAELNAVAEQVGIENPQGFPNIDVLTTAIQSTPQGDALLTAQTVAKAAGDTEGGDPSSPTQDGVSGVAEPFRLVTPGLVTNDHLGRPR